LFYEFWKFRAEISAPGAGKSKKSKKNGFFHGFLSQNTVFFESPGIFFVFLVHNSYSDQKKVVEVVEYNSILMLTQNLVEVGSVCGPGENKKKSMIFF
jgi:hypothetical protein